MDQALFIGFMVLVSGVLLYFGYKSHQKQLEAWTAFAHLHGMRASGLRIEGSYEGFSLKLETQRRGSGRNRYTVTVLRLWAGDLLPREFSLEREGFGDKILRFFGQKDAEIGDELFDQAFDLENVSLPTAKVLRHKVVQRHLYEVAKLYQDFSIRDGWIQVERRRVPTTVEELEEFTGPALMLAHTLEEAEKRTQGWKAG
jgi:hypothetical protein